MRKYWLVLFATLFTNVNVVFSENASTINVSSEAMYYDEKIIPSNIRKECTELGTNLSEFTLSYLEKYGFSASLSPDINKDDSGKNLILQINNVVSGGNAFVGHRKTVSIEAELYEDGELVDSYEATRNSGGGFGAGFKGSCTVLYRCVKTLGNDVAKWIKGRNE